MAQRWQFVRYSLGDINRIHSNFVFINTTFFPLRWWSKVGFDFRFCSYPTMHTLSIRLLWFSVILWLHKKNQHTGFRYEFRSAGYYE